MRHPFDLELSELESVNFSVVEELTDEEAANIAGGTTFTTQALGEEGGDVTTLALGEEGGDVTTLALGEEGGDFPKLRKLTFRILRRLRRRGLID